MLKKLNIPQSRLRQLRAFKLGKKSYEFQDNKNNKTLIDLCSNDYFGLSRDKEVINASYQTALREGLGSGGSRFISGTRTIHKILEEKLAKWLNQERVLLFPSGFQANIAAIQVLADKDTIVIADKFIHNSLIVGIQAANAKLVRFLHNNPNDLERKIHKYLDKQNILVVIESLYSMEGTTAPLKEITRICKKNNINLLVDEAHALGILGPKGKGLSINFPGDVDIISGTFGKSFGSGGAFLACNEKIAERIIQTSGAFRYTTALSPTLAAGALRSLEKIINNDCWGKDLLNLSKVWKNEINNLNYSVQGDCHILSIIIGEEKETLKIQKFLEDNGFLAVGIRPPTVPVGKSRIRITIRKGLNKELLKSFIHTLKSYK